MSQDGTYGYEPALSEDDVRAGKAAKALVMMRYVGLRDGSYILLLVDEDNPNISNRITCSAPCNFAKSQTMAGDSILKTETVRVVPNSLIGAMIEDAMSGQLTPYGQSTATWTQSQQSATAAPSTQSNLPVAPPVANQPASDAAASPLQQTSFDCAKAKSIPEFLICHDPDLAASDRDLATTYQQAKDAVVDKAAFVDRTRKQWNFREKNCRDKDCLTSWYAYQKRVLTKIAQTGDVNVQDN
ncbi:lysozyme inhibitor LprI family protein [Burkholderia sp. LMG 32019]|uniref:lysozyme inhibitor LprI family protein n=1 Tax=Burkholderia sp. LMG 32019 TaxID=3158173 RepID=UPI003C2D52FA